MNARASFPTRIALFVAAAVLSLAPAGCGHRIERNRQPQQQVEPKQGQAWSFNTPAKWPKTHFYFVQVTDTHFGRGDHANRAAQIARSINNKPMPIAFVAVTGDLFSDNIDNDQANGQLEDFVDDLKPPVHLLPGNHDILHHKGRAKTTAAMYTQKYGPLCYSVEYQGVVFVMIYTDPLARGFTLPGYDPLARLEAELKQADGKPTIVMHHIPSVEDFYRNKMHRGWPEDAQTQWIDLLNRYDVRAVIAGHFHRDEHHWLGDVPLYVSAPVAGFWGRQHVYRLFEYRDGKVGYRSQYDHK